MNRDEKLTRPTGLPPTIYRIQDRLVTSPSEPGGGTWIALNDSGACLALINWYSVPAHVSADVVSRGTVVNAVNVASGPEFVAPKLEKLPLEQIKPFRLIGIFPDNRNIVEWRWDLSRVTVIEFEWQPQEWISSGFDEATVQRVRRQTFQKELKQTTQRTLPWLRRLHSSHLPRRGPFSICMHRDDAATVSYTEINVSMHQAIMRHQQGAPCQKPNLFVNRIRLKRPFNFAVHRRTFAASTAPR